ncbi:mitochondrial 37S ribosomal protein [Martiniozyma asiatica (nom. inval.)]|nr:mitochondrial 37S ribosomal protein [Martiniozyma asiatica]
MLSRGVTASLRPATRDSLKASMKSTLSVRFASNNSKKNGGKNKPFYSEFEQFINTQKVDENGKFVRQPATEEDFKSSAYNKYLIDTINEKNNDIEEKLKALAEEHKVPYDDLKKQFNEKVEEQLKALENSNEEIEKTIENFENELKNSFSVPVSFWEELESGLKSFQQNLEQSAAFDYIKKIDTRFAEAISKYLRNSNKNDIPELKAAFESSPLSEISTQDYQYLQKLLAEKITVGNAEATLVETVEELPAEEFGDVDSETVVATILGSLSAYDNVSKAPLMALIQEVDPAFAKLVTQYSTLTEDEAEVAEKVITQIEEYCANKDSKIYSAFGDPASPNYSKIREILEQPLPIDMAELYEVFESHADYFTSETYKTVTEIDAKFAELLKELETVPEGTELDKVNDEIDAYLSNEESPIYIAMNDIQSEGFSKLRETLNNEYEILQNTLTTDKLIQYVADSGLETDAFKLLQKVDGEFANLVATLYTSESNESAMEAYNNIQQFLEQPTAISGALLDKESLNYKLLADIVIPKETEIETEKEEVAELSSEDANLSAEVIEINKKFDLALQAMQEIKTDLENEDYERPRGITETIDKIFGFDPTPEQTQQFELTQDAPKPLHTDPVIEQCVNLIMKGGRKDVARKYVNRTLYLLYLHTRQDPVEQLKKALDMCAPLVITKTVKTGFAKNFTIPVPLTPRQRNRMALMWILSSSDSRASNDFPVRLCDELLNVLAGSSKIMDKRALNHKMAITNRSYLKI